MPKATNLTIGHEQAAILAGAIRQLKCAPIAGSRDIPVLLGLNAPPKAIFTMSQDNVIIQACDALAASGRVYFYGDDVVIETDSHSGVSQSLRRLRTAGKVEAGTEAVLANLFTCQAGEVTFPPPRWFVHVLLMSDLLPDRLPRIQHYSNRPMFDQNFHLCKPGWHPDTGILVHGTNVEPVVPDAIDVNVPALERLPCHLQHLLSEFCYRDNADVANTIGMLLTGLLVNHFVESSKAIFLVDGNQPGLGKTLLVRAAGIVLDGTEPSLFHYSADDEELQKRIGAVLRGNRQSIILIDNAKSIAGSAVSSPTIESISMAPIITLRILGKSENVTRKNDLLWVMTMNHTSVSPDLASRGVPIQLAYEGQVEKRSFTGPDPIRYASAHRLDILGELAGMVVKWLQAGRPDGRRSHRCHAWAHIIGGILEVAGFPEFLANAVEAAAAFNSQLDEVAALAEAIVLHGGPYVEVTSFTEA